MKLSLSLSSSSSQDSFNVDLHFYRIVDSNPAWELFGFEMEENGSLKIKDKDFNEKLKVIILKVLAKLKFTIYQ